MKKAIIILIITMLAEVFAASTSQTESLGVYWTVPEYSYFEFAFRDSNGKEMTDGLSLQLGKTDENGVTGEGTAYFYWNVIINDTNKQDYEIGFSLNSNTVNHGDELIEWGSVSWEGNTTSSGYAVKEGVLNSTVIAMSDVITLTPSSAFGKKSTGTLPISFETVYLKDYTKRYSAQLVMTISPKE